MSRKHELTQAEWETLKSIGSPAAIDGRMDPWALAHLMAADLVTDENGRPALTAAGRSVIVRGFPESGDLAA